MPIRRALKSLAVLLLALPLLESTCDQSPRQPKLANHAMADAEQGALYSYQLTAAGGYPPYRFTDAPGIGSHPNGLSVSASGLVTGVPTTPLAPGDPAGEYCVVIDDQVSSVHDCAAIIIVPAAKISAFTLPAGAVGAPYTFTLASVGGEGSVVWSISQGGLPPGLALSAGGVISGTPTGAGTTSFTVRVTDALAGTDSAPASIHVTSPVVPTITTTALPRGEAGVGYHATLTAVNGATPYSWSVSSGSLPPGLSMSAAGVISGSPAAPGGAGFTVKVTDANGFNDSKPLSFFAQPAIAITDVTPTGILNQSYTIRLTTTGGVPPDMWTLTGGALPGGVSLAVDGTISGTPNARGEFDFTVTVVDSAGGQATAPLAFFVEAAPLAITDTSVADGEVGLPYTLTFVATGGTLPYSWSQSGGTLPAGLGFTSAGVLSGTPTTAQTTSFSIAVTDGAHTTAGVTVSMLVHPAVTVTTTTLAGGTQSVPYSASLTATDGVLPYSWAIVSGALPAGVTLSSTGVISGTPTVSGTFPFSAQVTDTRGGISTRPLTLTIAAGTLTITTMSLPDGEASQAYAQTLAATGGHPGYTWAVIFGSLPAGLSLSTGGPITGTLSATTGTSQFTIQVTDAMGITAARVLSIIVQPPPAIVTTSLAGGMIGSPYSQPLTGQDGIPPYVWSLTGGTLPAGLSLSAAGVISGTPTASGSKTFMVRLADAAGGSATQSLTIVILPAPLTIQTSSPLPDAEVQQNYNITFTASGGSGAQTWTLASGALPSGWLIFTNGVLSSLGLVTAPGTSSFSVRVVDAAHDTSIKAFTLTVQPAPVIVTTSLPNGRVGVAYDQTLVGQDGVPPYNWRLDGTDVLPDGLSLSADGRITGTPTTAQTLTFKIRLGDSAGGFFYRDFTMTIDP